MTGRSVHLTKMYIMQCCSLLSMMYMYIETHLHNDVHFIHMAHMKGYTTKWMRINQHIAPQIALFAFSKNDATVVTKVLQINAVYMYSSYLCPVC